MTEEESKRVRLMVEAQVWSTAYAAEFVRALAESEDADKWFPMLSGKERPTHSVQASQGVTVRAIRVANLAVAELRRNKELAAFSAKEAP